MKGKKLYSRLQKILTGLIILSLVILICFYRISKYNSELRNQRDMENAVMYQFRNQVDEDIYLYGSQLEKYLLDENIQNFVKNDVLDYYEISRISSKLGSDMSYSDDVIWGIFREGVDLYITGNGVLHDYAVMKSCGFKKSPHKEIGSCMKDNMISSYVSASEISVNILSQRQILHSDNLISFFLSIDISGKTERLKMPEKAVLYVFDGGEKIFSSSDAMNVDMKKIRLYDSQSVNGLQYGIYVPGSYNALHLIVFLLFSVIIIFIGIKLAKHISKWMYKPIDTILNGIPNAENEDVFDEAEYILQKYKKIEEECIESKDMLARENKAAKESFLRDVLYGLIDNEEIIRKQKKYGLQNLDDGFIWILIDVEENTGPSQAVHIIFSYLENSEIVQLRPNVYALILPDKDVDQIEEYIRKLFLIIEENEGISCYGIIYDEVIYSLKDFAESANKVLSASKVNSLVHKKILVRYHDILDEIRFDYNYPIEIELKIIDYFQNGEYEKEMKLLSKVLDENIPKTELSRGECSEFRFAIISTIKRMINIMNCTERDVFGKEAEAYLELDLCTTGTELKEKILSMFSVINNKMMKIYEKMDKNDVEIFEEYIEKNYMCADLSLVSMAQEFNYSIGYIGRYFKKIMGVNFADYLMRFRIKKATEILDNDNNIKIKELASMVGYDNVNSFIRNFKKVNLVAPNQYRERKK